MVAPKPLAPGVRTPKRQDHVATAASDFDDELLDEGLVAGLAGLRLADSAARCANAKSDLLYIPRPGNTDTDMQVACLEVLGGEADLDLALAHLGALRLGLARRAALGARNCHYLGGAGNDHHLGDKTEPHTMTVLRGRTTSRALWRRTRMVLIATPRRGRAGIPLATARWRRTRWISSFATPRRRSSSARWQAERHVAYLRYVATVVCR
jgi:hypothetical protein